MNSKHLITTFLAAILFGATSTPVAIAQNSQRILPAQLESMFSDMRAKAPWNVDGPLLWGYFFFDPNRDRLQAVANELAKAGYQVLASLRLKVATPSGYTSRRSKCILLQPYTQETPNFTNWRQGTNWLPTTVWTLAPLPSDAKLLRQLEVLLSGACSPRIGFRGCGCGCGCGIFWPDRRG